MVRGWLDFEYIKSKRSAAESKRIIGRLVTLELAKLSANPEYREALNNVEKIESVALGEIAARLTPTVREFVPDLREVRLERVLRSPQARVRDQFDLILDDGVATGLEAKGDGIQSLVTLALARQTKIASSEKVSLILAVDEPETHLHPDAIHSLRSILSAISREHQLIMTTHSPLLIDRERIENNILVVEGRALPARDFREIRAALGTRVSDNLASANLVLLTEGHTDSTLLRLWLEADSQQLREAFSQGHIVIERMGSAGNTENHARMYKSLVCDVHVILDDDQAGNAALKRAMDSGAIGTGEYFILRAKGLREATLEDFIEPRIYSRPILKTFGVDLNVPEFTKGREKWDERMKTVFAGQGKSWILDGPSAKALTILEAIKSGGGLMKSRKEAVQALVKRLEVRVEGVETRK